MNAGVPSAVRGVALIISMLALAACGSSTTASPEASVQEAETSAPTGTNEEVGQATGDEETAEITFIGNYSLSYLPIYVAEGAGYFEDQGISLERLPDIANGQQLAQVVMDGQADIAAIGSTTAYAFAAAGRELRSFAVLLPNLVFALTLTNDAVDRLAAEGVTPDSPLPERVEALRGLTLGVTPQGTTTDVLMRATLELHGLNPDTDVVLQPLDGAPAMLAAARGGTIDGFLFTPPTALSLAAEDTGEVWIDYTRGDVSELTNIYQLDVIATSQFLEERPDDAEAFLRAVWQAVTLIEQDQAAAAEAARTAFADLDPALFESSIEFVAPAFADGIVPTEEGFSRTREFADRTTAEPLDVDFNDVYVTEFAEQTRP